MLDYQINESITNAYKSMFKNKLADDNLSEITKKEYVSSITEPDNTEFTAPEEDYIIGITNDKPKTLKDDVSREELQKKYYPKKEQTDDNEIIAEPDNTEFNGDEEDWIVGDTDVKPTTIDDASSREELQKKYYPKNESEEEKEKEEDYSSIFEQANEIYNEQLADSRLSGGSDPYGDAEFTRMEFLCKNIPYELWDEYGIYDPHEEIRKRLRYEDEFFEEVGMYPDEYYGESVENDEESEKYVIHNGGLYLYSFDGDNFKLTNNPDEAKVFEGPRGKQIADMIVERISSLKLEVVDVSEIK